MKKRIVQKRFFVLASLWGLVSCQQEQIVAPAYTPLMVTPQTTGYDQARLPFNKKCSPFPAAIFLCQNATDVQKAVHWANRYRKKVTICSGRHHYEGYSIEDNAVVIDVSRLKDFYFDATTYTATLGAGLTSHEVKTLLWPHRRTIPVGSCPTVSVAGVTLGGGINFEARQMGLTCDSLISFDLVTAEGELISVRPDNAYADLFWACCGGGNGNFGVVTSLTFRTHPVDRVAVYEMAWDLNQLPAVSKAWFETVKNAPDALMMFLRVTRKGDQVFLTSFGQFLGSEERLRQVLFPLRQSAPSQEIIGEMDYMQAVHKWEGSPNSPRAAFQATSLYVKETLPLKALTLLKDAFVKNPGTNAFLVLDSYGGAIRRSHQGAFPHREALASIQIMTRWEETFQEPQHVQWVNNLRNQLARFCTNAAYVNYPDKALTQWPFLYYGKNYDRLRAVKTKYDSQNLFTYPQSIPPKEPKRLKTPRSRYTPPE